MPNRGGRSSGSARLSECIVGDESGTVVLTATGEQGAQSCCVISRCMSDALGCHSFAVTLAVFAAEWSADPQSHSSKSVAT